VARIYKSEAGRKAVEEQYRRLLQRWPVACEHRFVSTRQGDTFVVASGDPSALPVVLFHGSGTNSASWIRDVAAWAQHYRVYAVDLIGEPGLSAPSRPPLSSPAYAEWLDDVWAGLRLERASIVGISLGGWLGLDFAIRRPARVSSLSLISPSGIGRQRHLALLKIGALRVCGTWGLLQSLAFVTGRTGALPEPVVDALLVVFRNFRPRMERIPRCTNADLASLPMPVQVVVGSDDVLLDSRDTRERIEEHVRDATVVYVRHAGHVLPPQTERVSEFLKHALRAGGIGVTSPAVPA
jgi:pimeloyl-ACP methyl ester carboxylesterase